MTTENEWDRVADGRGGSTGQPGSQYHIVDVDVYRRDHRWRVLITEESGQNQGYREPNREQKVTGHGRSFQEAWSDADQSAADAGIDRALLVNAHSEASTEVENQFRGPGRPEVGPAVNIRFPDDLLNRIDGAASEAGCSRAEWIRQAAEHHLTTQ